MKDKNLYKKSFHFDVCFVTFNAYQIDENQVKVICQSIIQARRNIWGQLRFVPNTSMFIDFATFVPLPRLFQPPRLLER